MVFLWPVLLAVSVLIAIFDKGPVLFKQARVGKNGQLFTFYKFRSMPANTGDLTSAEIQNVSLSWIGKFIRRTNLDELPQFYNVLIGDMSMIGPRPCIEKQENLIKLREENGSLACLPGLTGLAQVNSYDDMPEEEKAEYDGKYCRDLSLLNDLRIVLGTLRYFTKKPPKY